MCYNQLPSEQKGIICGEKYLLLVNPFPIFEEHFTIPLIEHRPQELLPHFSDMLEIAKELSGKYSVFYNGPKCGASAPDHMHFQGSPQNSMPIEKEASLLFEDAIKIKKDDGLFIYSITKYLRNLFVIESANKEKIIAEFNNLYRIIRDKTNSTEEPMMNVIASFDEKWRVFIFPRKAHRQTQYFASGKEQILLSPAAVDFGGLLITPREEDFLKITLNDIEDIFQQTTIENSLFQNIVQKLQ